MSAGESLCPRLVTVTKGNQDATGLHPGCFMMLSTSRHSVVVALSGANTPSVVTPMRVGVTGMGGFRPSRFAFGAMRGPGLFLIQAQVKCSPRRDTVLGVVPWAITGRCPLLRRTR